MANPGRQAWRSWNEKLYLWERPDGSSSFMCERSDAAMENVQKVMGVDVMRWTAEVDGKECCFDYIFLPGEKNSKSLSPDWDMVYILSDLDGDRPGQGEFMRFLVSKYNLKDSADFAGAFNGCNCCWYGTDSALRDAFDELPYNQRPDWWY